MYTFFFCFFWKEEKIAEICSMCEVRSHTFKSACYESFVPFQDVIMSNSMKLIPNLVSTRWKANIKKKKCQTRKWFEMEKTKNGIEKIPLFSSFCLHFCAICVTFEIFTNENVSKKKSSHVMPAKLFHSSHLSIVYFNLMCLKLPHFLIFYVLFFLVLSSSSAFASTTSDDFISIWPKKPCAAGQMTVFGDVWNEIYEFLCRFYFCNLCGVTSNEWIKSRDSCKTMKSRIFIIDINRAKRRSSNESRSCRFILFAQTISLLNVKMIIDAEANEKRRKKK